MILTEEQQTRYNRHIVLDGFGTEAQVRLLGSKVLIVGAGGLGSPVALYLAAAGVGTLGVVDSDTVSISNLQRQVIHSTLWVGKPKTDSAQERITELNPDVRVLKYPVMLTHDNADGIIKGYDFVVDASDNFTTKYLVNDTCVRLDKPFCLGGILGFQGQLMTYVPGSACYRCLFPEPPSATDGDAGGPIGVLGSVAGMLGTIEATECIKYLTGTGRLLTNTLLTFDALTMGWERIEFIHNDKCTLCGGKAGVTGY